MIIDRKKTYNEYFQAYIDVNKIKDGEEVKLHEYASWIHKKHDTFRRMKGCPYCNGYPPDVSNEFIAFINKPCEAINA